MSKSSSLVYHTGHQVESTNKLLKRGANGMATVIIGINEAITTLPQLSMPVGIIS